MKMNNSFKRANEILKKDKKIILFSFIPVCIGVIFYSFLGHWIYTDVLKYVQGLVSGYTGDGGMLSTALYWILGVLLTVGVYFLVSWTFILVISILAGPFNDIIAERILHANNIKVASTFSTHGIIKGLSKVLYFELKKFVVIITLTLSAFVMGIFPILTPIAIILNIMVFVSNFYSFSWSHLHTPVRTMISSLFKNIIKNLLFGAPLLFLTMIPFVNLLVYPYCVVFFTQYWIDHNLLKDQGI